MIFIDTCAFIARYLTKDQHHKTSLEKWQKIQTNKERCFTSNFVLDETFTILGRWASYEFSAEKAHIIYSSAYFEVLRPTEEDEIKAITYFKKYADHHVSYTDCVSFVLMKKYHIKRVFSFDKHFVLAKYDFY